MSYRTPNVYVEEVSTFPPSVPGVATAVPAFVGYTEKGPTFKATRITDLLEYESIFGDPEKPEISVGLKGKAATGAEQISVTIPDLKQLLHPSLRMFFNNGGRDCYIISVGHYSEYEASSAKENFSKGLKALEKEDEPTLILLTDAVKLSENDYYSLQQEALQQCADMKDRFVVIDVLKGDENQDISSFRNKIGMENLKYGAAYYPYLMTSLNYDYDETTVAVPTDFVKAGDLPEWEWEDSAIKVAYQGLAIKPMVKFIDEKGIPEFQFNKNSQEDTLTIILPGDEEKRTTAELVKSFNKWKNPKEAFSITVKEKEEKKSKPPKTLESIGEGTHELLKVREWGGEFSGVKVTYRGSAKTPNVVLNSQKGAKTDVMFSEDRESGTFTINLPEVAKEQTSQNIVKKWKEWTKDTKTPLFEIKSSSAKDEIIKLEKINLNKIRNWIWEGYGLKVRYTGPAKNPSVKFTSQGGDSSEFKIEEDDNQGLLTIRFPVEALSQTVAQIPLWEGDGKSFAIEKQDPTAIINKERSFVLFYDRSSNNNDQLASIKTDDTQLYNKIKSQLAEARITLPPSAAVAGVYSRVDQERGVWKAPANVSLSSVVGPTIKITNREQEKLNVDNTGGKSINAIRSFTGKGTLIWGARTLLGNDNEWQYVSVRRLFIYLEESIQKATAFAVFEPNNAMTWLKVRTMIESFLDELWRQGAMVGTTAEQAYFVQVGLGTTMTDQDILNGKMIIEIGLAAVRPAEFIILRFSHKLQES